MLATVIQKSTPWWQNFTLSWFDMMLLAVLIFGVWRGRRRGMTKEFFPTLQWLAILLGAGFGYPYLAGLLKDQGVARQEQSFFKSLLEVKWSEETAACLTAYLIIALVFLIIFVTIKRQFHQKLEGSNLFGSFEYYWGVVAGLVRYASIVLVMLALLNAPVYTQADINADKAYKNRWYGGGMKDFSGNFIPTIYETQDSIFKQSYSGAFIKDYLSILLINTVPDQSKNKHS